MRAKDNPLAMVPFSIAKGVRKNFATIHFNFKNVSMMTRDVSLATFKREVFILGPEPVSEYMISQGFCIAGDMKCTIPTLGLERAIQENRADDPKGFGELANLRTLNATDGGLDVGTDILEVGGVKFRIIQMFGESIWKNTPAKFRCTLRKTQDGK